eukprot:gene17278-11664_t
MKPDVEEGEVSEDDPPPTPQRSHRSVEEQVRDFLKKTEGVEGQSLDVTKFKRWFPDVAASIGDKTNASGWTMLHFAAAYNAPAEATQLVLDAGPEAAKVAGTQGVNPLHCAMKRGSAADIVAILLGGYPAAAKMKDSFGRTPLHVGLWNAAQAASVKLVVQAWPDAANEVDIYGSTPLDSGLAKKASEDTLLVVLNASTQACSVPNKLNKKLPLRI